MNERMRMEDLGIWEQFEAVCIVVLWWLVGCSVVYRHIFAVTVWFGRERLVGWEGVSTTVVVGK